MTPSSTLTRPARGLGPPSPAMRARGLEDVRLAAPLLHCGRRVPSAARWVRGARSPLSQRGPDHAERRAADPIGNGGTRHQAKPDRLVETPGWVVVPNIQAKADAASRRFGKEGAEQ